MHISDFDYELPPQLIALQPARPRDAARMLVLDRATGDWIDSGFRSLPEFLRPSDVLVINDTRVLRARTAGRLVRSDGSTRAVEVLFNAPAGDGAWEVLCRPGKRMRRGDRIVFAHGEAQGIVGETLPQGVRLLHMDTPVEHFLSVHGQVPLPPYIERDPGPLDAADYQTIYAAVSGAVAAPTAGLHFTDKVFDALRQKGIEIVAITLHVGVGTFIPVRTDNPAEHVLKPERFHMSAEAARRLNAARLEGRRIVAVGTTTTRTLEYVAAKLGEFRETAGEAGLLILPGYEFKAVSAMLTNFHLPKSTLIMLVSAFASREKVLAAYRHAIEQRYRFYSYGDCMLIM
jgi:S-adenosylmethionine:tRNA ribosyltransferase-isomerase